MSHVITLPPGLDPALRSALPRTQACRNPPSRVPWRGGKPATRALLGILGVVSSLLTAACGADSYRMTDANATALTGGDPDEGRVLIRSYGCGSCHTIPGVPGADGRVGPPLTDIAGRMYIAGILPNSPANLIRWIEDPRAVDPHTAMPDVAATHSDARDIAAYLYTLR